jgi:toxin ParE1/3/4
MGVYKLSSKAEIDLAAMYEFGIYKFGLSHAQKYFYAMHEAFEVLSENLNLGRDASEFIEDLKRFSYNGYFGVMTPPFSVKLRHFERSYNYKKN